MEESEKEEHNDHLYMGIQTSIICCLISHQLDCQRAAPPLKCQRATPLRVQLALSRCELLLQHCGTGCGRDGGHMELMMEAALRMGRDGIGATTAGGRGVRAAAETSAPSCQQEGGAPDETAARRGADGAAAETSSAPEEEELLLKGMLRVVSEPLPTAVLCACKCRGGIQVDCAVFLGQVRLLMLPLVLHYQVAMSRWTAHIALVL